MPIECRLAEAADLGAVTDMFLKLYGAHHDREALMIENEALLADPTQVLFLVQDGGKPIGAAHGALRREYVQGVSEDVCGYLEGVYTEPEYRHQGAASLLVAACEDWASQKGCTLFASDCNLDNTDSLHFHLRLGFKEVSRNIHFVKPLPGSFRDIKSGMDVPAVHRIIACASFDVSEAGVKCEVDKYRASEALRFYGYFKEGRIAGICGFEEHGGRVEIHLIAVDEAARSQGIGRAMVAALQERYHKPIEAETDDDAVDFYRKLGFEVTCFTHPKHGKRWTCILSIN